MPHGRRSRPNRAHVQVVKPRNPEGQGDDGKRTKFAKAIPMATLKSMVDTRRQTTALLKDEEYIGRPPLNHNLLEARLVLPGKHLLPIGLDDPGALDVIRKSFKVWVTRPEPHVLVIHAEDTLRLQEAWQATNWAIHDMRVSNEHQSTRFIIQQPITVASEAKITVNVGFRPHVMDCQPVTGRPYSILDTALSQLHADTAPVFDSVMAVEKHLKMRINFGHVIASQKKKTPDDQVSYEDLATMARLWSRRGGAALETRLPDASLANRVVDHMVNPEHDLCDSPDIIESKCSLLLTSEDCILEASITILEHGDPQISTIRVMKTEHCARLNWTVMAPDMGFDWNLRVDGMEIIGDVPEKFQNVLQKINLKMASGGPESQGLMRFPNISLREMAPKDPEILSTRLKMSTVIPFKDTPFAVEVSATRVWKGMGVSEGSGVESWGVEFYGMHWEEAINHVNAGEVRKDWGEDLKYMWVGDEPSLNVRYKRFLRSILEVQQVLNEVDASSGKP